MRKYRLLLFFLLLCGLIAAQDNNQNNKAYYLEKDAVGLLNQKKYQEAIEKYNQVIELVSNNSGLYYNRAWCYEKLTMYDAAIADLEKSVQYNEKNSDAHYLLAQMLYFKGEKEKALSHFSKVEGERETPQNQLFLEAMQLWNQEKREEALVLFKQCAELNIAAALSNYYAGLIYYNWKQNEQAVEHFQKALKLKSFKYGSDVFLYLGWAEAILKRYYDAINTLNKYIEKGPPVAQAYYHRGMSRLKIRDFTHEFEPLEDFKKVREMKPESVEGAYGVACFHIVAHRYAAGKALLDSLIQVHPRVYELYVELGKAYVGLKRPDKAQEAFNTAKRLNVKMPDPYLEAGKLYLDQNQPQLALQELETAMRLAPADKIIPVYHARAISLLGRAKEAQQTLKDLFSLPYGQFPSYYQRLAHYILGMILLENNKEEAGMQHMEDAYFNITEAGLYYGDWWLKQGDKKNAQRIYTGSLYGSKFDDLELECRIGSVFLSQKKYWDASFAYEKAVKLDPELTEARLNLGRAYAGTKQYDHAIEQLTKVTELDSKCSEAYYQRALIHLKLKDKDKAERDLQAACNLGHENARKRLEKM